MIFNIVFLFTQTISAHDTLEIPYFDKVNVKVDGKLTESIYDSAYKIYSLTQISPVPDTIFPEPTTVYIFQSRDGIYFGFHCETIGRRPQRTIPYDMISVYLDTYLDRKSAYLFELGADGTKMTARVTDDGNNYDFNFETIWKGNVYCAENYFEAEFLIPWKGIMGKKGEWGLDIERSLPNGTSGELSVYNPYKESFRISRFKVIKDINFQGSEIVTKIQPIFILEHGEDFAGVKHYAPNLGGNIFLRMRENLKIGATFNPDFAEIEADPFQLNFSKYALSYAETRPFFCEGKEFFSLSGAPLSVFYSRQIGKTLPSGGAIPISFAGKAFLKTDMVEVAALYAKTKSAQDMYEFDPATDFLVNKMKVLLTKSFSVSLLGAYRFPYRESAKGLLGTELFYQDSLTSLSMEQVFDNYTSKDYATAINFSKEIAGVTFKETIFSIPENFSDQAVGYIPWEGLNEVNPSISYTYFLNKVGLYNITPSIDFSYTRRDTGEPYVWNTTIGCNTLLKSQSAICLYLSYGKDFECDTLFTAPAYTVAVFGNKSHIIGIDFSSSWSKIYNYRQNYVGWVATNYAKLLLKKGSFFSTIGLIRWDEFDPANKLAYTTYLLSPLVALGLAKRLYLNFYMNLPLESKNVISERIGCYLTWNPEGETWVRSVYNDYRERSGNDWVPYIRKTTLKSQTSWYF